VSRDSQPHTRTCDGQPHPARQIVTDGSPIAISPDEEGEVILLPLARLTGRFRGLSESQLRAALCVAVRMELDLDDVLELVRYLDSPEFLAARRRRSRVI
jgi:hypothetical protein